MHRTCMAHADSHIGVSLERRLEARIDEKVRSGQYPDASAVVREALRLLDERERVDELRVELQIGLAQIERGETVEYTPELLEQLAHEAERNARLGKPVKDAVTP